MGGVGGAGKLARKKGYREFFHATPPPVLCFRMFLPAFMGGRVRTEVNSQDQTDFVEQSDS